MPDAKLNAAAARAPIAREKRILGRLFGGVRLREEKKSLEEEEEGDVVREGMSASVLRLMKVRCRLKRGRAVER